LFTCVRYILLCGYRPFYAHCGKDCAFEEGQSCEKCQVSNFWNSLKKLVIHRFITSFSSFQGLPLFLCTVWYYNKYNCPNVRKYIKLEILALYCKPIPSYSLKTSYSLTTNWSIKMNKIMQYFIFTYYAFYYTTL